MKPLTSPIQILVTGDYGEHIPEYLGDFYRELREQVRYLMHEAISFDETMPILPDRYKIKDLDRYNDRRNLIAAQDLLLAYVGRPSFRVGQEIEWAIEQGTPVYAFWFEKDQEPDATLKGNPIVRTRKYNCTLDKAPLSEIAKDAYFIWNDYRTQLWALEQGLINKVHP